MHYPLGPNMWNTPAVTDVTADERFADVPDGYTTISDTSGRAGHSSPFRLNVSTFM